MKTTSTKSTKISLHFPFHDYKGNNIQVMAFLFIVQILEQNNILKQNIQQI